MIRRLILIGGGLLALLVGLGAAGLAWLGSTDFAAMAAQRATTALGREVRIESLRISPGRWLGLSIQGLRIANLEGGSRAQMVELGALRAEVEVASLLHGPPVLRGVEVDGLSVLLERIHDAHRTRNWRFGPPRPEHAPPKPEDRSSFPMLSEVRLRNSEVVFRTSSGNHLRGALQTATITTAGPDEPVTLQGHGSYNATPVSLEGRFGAITTLRNAAIPWPTDLHVVAGGDTRLHLQGTMTAPLDADGIDGRVSLDAPDLATLARLAGTELPLKAPIRLEGLFIHRGDHWQLTQGNGSLGGEALTVRLAELREGTPDAVRLDVGLPVLDLDRLLAGLPHGATAPAADPALAIALHPDPVADGRVTVGQLRVSGQVMADVVVHGAITPGRLAVPEMGLTIYGTRVTGSASAQARGQGAHVTAGLAMANADIETLRRAFGLRPLPLGGRLNGRLAVSTDGDTVRQAVRDARISAVVSLQHGRVAREVMELASMDARLLFRHAQGNTDLTCILGVMDLNAGVGTIAPLRMRAENGTIAGTASVNLPRRTLDMVVGTDAATTSSWALDVPVRISGPFADPDIRPARWSSEGRSRLAAGNEFASLPPDLRSYARGNPCSRPTPPARPATPQSSPARRGLW